ncbi:MAG TPA: helix-turn-helix domain-containing protein [Caulobacteraceae bacterium]|nr:helix-turn-helix domain-containing protein [Caulobacteraceae bacterium]
MARSSSKSVPRSQRPALGPAPETASPEQALAALGFTETEAAVYCELLRAAPLTGYRLAHAIGKAPANVYQALAALSQKGAVLVEDREARSYRATHPEELLAMLQRGYETHAAEARAALESLRAPAPDDRLYQLATVGQVYSRAEAMIDAAAEVLLFDLFPRPFARLRPRLEQAAARGVRIAGVVYEAVDCPFLTAVSPGGEPVAAHWPGLQIGLVVDGREHLKALLSRDETQVKHGVWSNSTYLACLEHNGLGCEIWVSLAAPPGQPPGDFTLFASYPPGLRELLAQGEENAGAEAVR